MTVPSFPRRLTANKVILLELLGVGTTVNLLSGTEVSSRISQVVGDKWVVRIACCGNWDNHKLVPAKAGIINEDGAGGKMNIIHL